MKNLSKNTIENFVKKAIILTKKECKNLKGGITNTEITDV